MNKKSNSKNNLTKWPVRDIVLDGLLVAIVFVSTYFIQFKLPFASNGGLVHMGNVALFTIAFLLGPRRGAVSGAFGMALFDLLSIWAHWAPFTFVVRGVMGWILGKTVSFSKGKPVSFFFFSICGVVISGIWMIGGYYITEVIIYKNLWTPIQSIPANLMQIGLGAAVSIPLSYGMRTKVSHASIISKRRNEV